MSDLLNTVTQGDCLEVMRQIPDKSVDMILCDLPYGTTACKWDSVIPFDPLWAEYERVIKPNGAIVLTAAQPFTSALIMSNPKLFKQALVWEKDKPSNFPQAKRRFLSYKEDIVVFYKKPPTYNPQMVNVGKPFNRYKDDRTHNEGSIFQGSQSAVTPYRASNFRYPKDIIKFPAPKHNDGVNGCLHPTQKPVALFEYLIKTYSNEGDVVLDNCLGSGTTAVAAINTNRQFIGIEREPEYVAISNQRITDAIKTKEATANDNE